MFSWTGAISIRDVVNQRLETRLERLIKLLSKIQLVLYYQCCVLIGWAPTRLYRRVPIVATVVTFGISSLWGSLLSVGSLLSGNKNRLQIELAQAFFPIACVASVSSRGSSRKLGQEQKKKKKWMNFRAITRLETPATQAIFPMVSMFTGLPHGWISRYRGDRVLHWLRGGKLHCFDCPAWRTTAF